MKLDFRVADFIVIKGFNTWKQKYEQQNIVPNKD